MKLKYCLLAMLWLVTKTYSQSSPDIQPLTISAKVPEIEITNLYNYPSSKIRLSDFKGKLVILDFWSTWCGSCIEAFPKMHILQKEFEKNIQVLLVNSFMGDDEKKVKPYFEKRKLRTGKNIELPYSLQQSSLSKYFPHKYLPHYAWIDKTGKLIAITSENDVTRENVAAIVNGNKVSLHTKSDMLDFNPEYPLFKNGNGGLGNDFLFRSLITGYIEGLGITSGLNETEGKITRYYLYNHLLITLLKHAYPSVLKYSLNRTLIEISDSTLFKSKDLPINYKQFYCYEIIVPLSTIEEIQSFIQEDLKRYFNIRVHNERRLINCLIIENSEQLSNLHTKGGIPEVDIEKTSVKRFLRNQPVRVLVDILNSQPLFAVMPVLDRTGKTENIDLTFDIDLTNMEKVKSFLRKNGFKITEAKENIEVSVISDKSFQ